jgi:hypothetical protein
MRVFCNLGVHGYCAHVFSATRHENLRYTKRCTLSFIFPEHVTHGKLGSRGWNPNGYDIVLHNRIRFSKYGETMWPRRRSRVRPLRSFGLLFVRKGMLRTGAMRILLRLSRGSFMPEGFSAN